MNPGTANRLLQAANAWWRDPERWTSSDPDLVETAAAPFNYAPGVLDGIEVGSVYLLRGPRRAGKSVSMKQTIARLIASGVNPRAIIHFSCDTVTRADLDLLIRTGRDVATRTIGDEPRYWFLDEITSIPGNWAGVVKNLRDNTGLGDDCVVLTGSSARSLRSATKDLAGRRKAADADAERLLLPMGFRAFCRAIQLPPDAPNMPHIPIGAMYGDALREGVLALQPWLDDLLNAWEVYLTVGGFPQAVRDYVTSGQVDASLRDALFQVLYGEVLRQSPSFRGSQMDSLLGHLSRTLCNPLSLRRLATAMAVADHHAAEARLTDLTLAYFIWECAPVSSDLETEVRGTLKKRYFTDPLLAQLANLRDPARHSPPDSSAVSEQQIGLALLRQREHDRPGTFLDHSVYFHRTASRKEIDLVAGWMHRVAIEGKYVDDALGRSSRTMRSQIEAGVITHGIMATRGITDLDGPLYAVPAPILAWLIEPER